MGENWELDSLAEPNRDRQSIQHTPKIGSLRLGVFALNGRDVPRAMNSQRKARAQKLPKRTVTAPAAALPIQLRIELGAGRR